MAVSIPHASWWQSLQSEVLTDPFYASLSTATSRKPLILRDGVWFRNSQIFLNPSSPLISSILSECHCSPLGGHLGYHKTLAKVKQSFIWSNITGAVKKFIKECDVCQRYKSDCLKPAGLLQPLPIPSRVWSDVSMDFIEGLPPSNTCTVIMVVVDRLSKYAHFIPLRHPFTAATVANAFINNVVKLHGIPTSIVSDRDKVFLSNFWRTLFELQGTQLCMSSSYHPQTDGQTEVVNRTLEQYLRCFSGDQPRQWHRWIPWAEFCYNTSIHSSINMTPYEAVYGVPPTPLLAYVPGTSKLPAVDSHLRDRDAIMRDLRQNLHLAQGRMKLYADKHRREMEFSVGDSVYLKLQPYRQNSVAFRRNLKLAPRFYGPYPIVERLGPVAYRLALPPGSQIHDVFHVSLLRKCLRSTDSISSPLPPVAADSSLLPEPEKVLDRRVIRKGNYRPKTEVLIQWKGVPVEDASWENAWRFQKQYPSFILADKDISGGMD